MRRRPASHRTAATPKDAAPKPAAGTTRLVVLVPVNVTIAPGIDLVTDAAKPHVNVPLKTCIQAACLGQIELTDGQMQVFRGIVRSRARSSSPIRAAGR